MKIEMKMKASFLRIGQDVHTPDGYGEIIEIFDTGYVLVEFANRKRQQYLKRQIKNILYVHIF